MNTDAYNNLIMSGPPNDPITLEQLDKAHEALSKLGDELNIKFYVRDAQLILDNARFGPHPVKVIASIENVAINGVPIIESSVVPEDEIWVVYPDRLEKPPISCKPAIRKIKVGKQ